jgi:hypothetical protein
MHNPQILPPVEPDHTEVPIPQPAPEPDPSGLPPEPMLVALS